MPSSNIDSWTRVSDTVPLWASGQNETSALEPFRKQAQAVPIPPQHFDQIATTAAEDENVPGEWILFQNRFYIALNPVKPRRRSVTPAAIQICVLVGSAITGSDLLMRLLRRPERLRLGCATAHNPDLCR